MCEGSLNRCTFRRNTKTETGAEHTGQEAEYLFRRSILPEIGEMRCRDLKAEHLRTVLRKLAGTGLSYESVSKVRFAMGDMVKRMVAEEYLTSNIADGPEDAKDGEAVGSFAPPSCDAGRVLASVDCSRRKRAAGVRPGDFLRVAGIGGLWIEKRRSLRAGSDPSGAVVVQGLTSTRPRRMRFGRLASGQRFSSGLRPGSQLCPTGATRGGSFRASGL